MREVLRTVLSNYFRVAGGKAFNGAVKIKYSLIHTKRHDFTSMLNFTLFALTVPSPPQLEVISNTVNRTMDEGTTVCDWFSVCDI